MKRVVLVAGLVVVLACAAVAAGAVKHYRGPVEQGGHVTFQTKVKHGKVKNVRQFFFFKVKLSCENGQSIPISNQSPIKFPIPPMKVKHRKFHGSFYKQEFKTRGEVEGEFSDHYRKAAGTLRVHGRPLGSSFGKCDTGTVGWRAKKQ
jgi:opacity protein-like surface antigen